MEFTTRNCLQSPITQDTPVLEQDKLFIERYTEFVQSNLKRCVNQYMNNTGLALQIMPSLSELPPRLGLDDGLTIHTYDNVIENLPTINAHICRPNLEYPGKQYDCVFLTDILHLTSQPHTAIIETHRMLKLDGYMFFSSKYNLPISDKLIDNFRFNEKGMATELYRYGFRAVEVLALETPDRPRFPIGYFGVFQADPEPDYSRNNYIYG